MRRPSWRPTASGGGIGHRHTQTFIAVLAQDGLAQHRLIAPRVLDCALNRDSFGLSIARELAPVLQPGQIVVANNLSSRKSLSAQELLRAQGNDLIFLPLYSPELNPVETAFSKLKALIRKAAARTYQALWKAVGAVCDLFQPRECRTCLTAAGWDAIEGDALQ